ncbi:uncharacterized protein LOC112588783 [Harpegnathos saltator]|nr:uncharacterized protein LOC112588783 [Harpegnathos saltator]
MLEYIITKEKLQQIIVHYLSTYAYGFATPDDFLKILNRELHQSGHAHHYNVAEILRFWMSQKHYPKLLAQQNNYGMYDYGSNNMSTIKIKYYGTKGIEWSIPVTFMKETQSSFTSSSSVFWLNNELSSENVDFPNTCDAKTEEECILICNAQQFGEN